MGDFAVNKEILELIEVTATKTAEKVLTKLKTSGRIKYYLSSTFKKTEEILRIYPSLPSGNLEKAKIASALKKLEDDEYVGIIADYYFDGLTTEKIAEYLDCKKETVSYNRRRLVKYVSNELFPAEAVKNLLS